MHQGEIFNDCSPCILPALPLSALDMHDKHTIDTKMSCFVIKCQDNLNEDFQIHPSETTASIA